MNPEIKNCQNCKKDFTIEVDDFSFYAKIKVPPPTFCPECSHQRRFAWRNTHSLYSRPDSVTGQNVISIYSPEKQLNIVDQKYWWSDAWDPFDYGFEYDFSKTFFDQWKHLYSTIPLQALSNSKAVNSDYCNVAEESYDCYLISACWKNERVMYSDSLIETKDSSDLYVVQQSEFCYEDVYCSESYRLFYSEKTTSSTDSYFLYDCKGCVNCFMCSNLRNKSYCFKNVQYSKEEYIEKLKEYDLGSFETIQKLLKDFEILRQSAIHKYATVIKSQNVTGNDISNTFNCKYVFDVSNNVKDSKHLFWVTNNIFDCHNCNAIGALENSFETCDAGVGGSHCLFSNVVYGSNNVEYSFNCYNCSDLFGCMGLRSKSYCILNRQYSKEEYFFLLEKIKQHMFDMPYFDKAGRVYTYGEFFPVELSPFSYNETIANDFYPLSKEETLSKGFSYKDKEEKHYVPTMNKLGIPDNISDISEGILNEIIECDTFPGSQRCTTAFKITQNEFIFYKRFGIPLPRRCYQCRHKERFNRRNPLKLWHRSCMCDKANHEHTGNCANEFETSYSPDRPETIYCEKCYQQEVI